MSQPEANKSDLARLRISEDRRGKKSRLLPRLALMGLVAVALWFFRDRWLPGASALLAPEVTIAAVEELAPLAAPPGSLTANGYVVAQRQAELAPKVAGKLEELLVVEGSRVEANQILARLEKRDLDAQLARAEAGVRHAEAERLRALADREGVTALIAESKANITASEEAAREADAGLADARREYERATQLLEGGAGTRGELDRAKADFDQAEARQRRSEALVSSARLRIATLNAQASGADAAIQSAAARIQGDEASVELLKAQIEYLTIRAPFAGVVIQKNAEVGEIVAPISGGAGAKVAVVTVVDMESLMVEAEVSEAYIRRVTAEQAARITVDAFPEESFAGKVFQVVPTANRQKATVQVKVAFDRLDPRIVPEMAARVFFLEGPMPAAESSGPRTPKLYLPAAAVQKGGFVWLLDAKDSVHKRGVRTGDEAGGRVEILEGLAAGDRVVASGADGLVEGAQVRVARRNS